MGRLRISRTSLKVPTVRRVNCRSPSRTRPSDWSKLPDCKSRLRRRISTPCDSSLLRSRLIRTSRGFTPSRRTCATPGIRSSGLTIRRSRRSQLSLRSRFDDSLPSTIGMSASRESQLVLTVISPMSSGRSLRIRSMRSHTSTRAICMSCDQSNSSRTIPPSSPHRDHISLRPLIEPRASSAGRTIIRSICSGEAFSYENRTNNCGSTTSGINASGSLTSATSPSTSKLTMIMRVVTWRLMASSGNVMRVLLR